MRTIRVTGKGKIKVKPDMTRLLITLQGTCKEYGETLKRTSEETEALKELLSSFGFERTDLKTLAFNINTRYESYKSGNNYKQRFAGYEYWHRLKVEFPNDNARLGKVMYALANSILKPEFQISYTVSDPEAVKNELLGVAVRDAIAKAGVLAGASGVTLKDIQSVDYSWGEVDFEIRPMRMDLCEYDMTIAGGMKDSYDMDIEPDDVDVADTVTVVWEIS